MWPFIGTHGSSPGCLQPSLAACDQEGMGVGGGSERSKPGVAMDHVATVIPTILF